MRDQVKYDDADVEGVETGSPTGTSTETASRMAGDVPCVVTAPTDQLRQKDPTRYEILGEHGRGGIGVVMEAFDAELDRTVALKELHRVSVSSEARFMREAKITARLEHPGIVPVHECGRWPNGTPFYSMKLVSGRSLRDVSAECKTLEDRLALIPKVLAVSEAIGYAHSERIIHRDLKPANVMVGEFGETVVIDWGLAKDLDGDDFDEVAAGPYRTSADHALTVAGTVMGTPAYMAPEQARGEAVDERTDVYALGVMLYQMLTGALPFEASSSAEVLRRVLDSSPEPIEVHDSRLSVDLRAIVSKAMSYDSCDRYENAAELAVDLRRFTQGQLVAARDYTFSALIRNWIGRHRQAVFISCMALMVVAVAGVYSARRVLAERDRARAAHRVAEGERANARAERDRLILSQATNALDTDPTRAIAWLKAYPVAGADPRLAASIAADAKSRGVARRVLAAGEGPTSGLLVVDGELVAASTDGTLRRWSRTLQTRELLADNLSPAPRLAAAPGPRSLLAYVATDKRVWVRSSNGETASFDVEGTAVLDLAFASGGRIVAAGCIDGRIRIFKPASNEATVLHDTSGAVYRVEVSPDGRWLASIALDKTLRIWDLQAFDLVFREALDAQPLDLRFSSGGEQLAVSLASGGLVLLEVPGWKTRRLRGGASIVAPMNPTIAAEVEVGKVRFDSHARLAAVSGAHGQVTVWDLKAESVRTFSHPGTIFWMEFAPDAPLILVGGANGLLRSTNVETGAHIELSGHNGNVHEGQFGPDNRLFTGGEHPQIRVWDNVVPLGVVLRGSAEPVFHVAVPSSGRRFAVESRDGTVALWDADTGVRTSLGAHDDLAWGIDFAGSGAFVASAGWDGKVRVWPTSGSGRQLALSEHDGVVECLDISPDEQLLVSGGEDGRVLLWDLASVTHRDLGSHVGFVRDVAFSPDGLFVASGGADGVVRLSEVGGGTSEHKKLHSADVEALSFVPGTTRLASTGRDGTVLTWDYSTGEVHTLIQHTDVVTALAVSPTADLIASGSRDRDIGIFDLKTGEVRKLNGHTGWVRAVSFSPDGRLLASASEDMTVRVWDLSADTQAVLRGHKGTVVSVEFTPDGQDLISTSWDGTTRLWTLPRAPGPPTESTKLHRWLNELSTISPETIISTTNNK